MTAKAKKARKVEVFDTSLRDGLQQPNLEISVDGAVSLLGRMAGFGVRYAEIGFAGANQFVGELCKALKDVDTGAMRLALFGRSRGRGVKVSEWADVKFMLRHKGRVPTAVVVVKSRLLDVAKSLETTPEENLLMARETVACLQDAGLEVLVDLEHAMDACGGRVEFGARGTAEYVKRSKDYFHEMVGQCVEQKVARIVVCDTTGGASPEEVKGVIAGLVKRYPLAAFGFHGHTDRGFGEANTRAAILAGAVQVQGTILGTGERCGNVNLTTVIGGMQLRGEAEFVSAKQLEGLCGLAAAANTAFGLEMPHGAPIVGAGAFGTWAGMHGSSERKNPGAYLWCDPAKVGATPVIGVNAQSGRANIMLLSKTLGVELNAKQAQAFLEEHQAMVDGGGYTASEVSFKLHCRRALGTLVERFSVKGWKVLDETDPEGGRHVKATMRLEVYGRAVTASAEGEGPVDALTRAMRSELEKHCPELKEIRLGTFSVMAIDVSANDTAALVRVVVTFHAEGRDPWKTAGVSSDLNQAALMAIVDGLHYGIQA